MISVALQSAAYHRRSLLATGLVGLVGTALVAGMAGILASGLAPGANDADRPFLTQFPAIMGSWILAIVVFAVVSTVGVALDGRTEEIGGMRLIGATPGQVRRMVALETAAVALAAALPGVAVSYLVGWVIVAQVRDVGLIHPESVYRPGLGWPVLAAGLIVLASIAGGYLGARTLAARSPVEAAGPSDRASRSGRVRRIVAAALIMIGLISSASSLAMPASSVYATAATGPGCVLVAVGLCLLARELVGLAERVLRLLPAGRSASWHLARINLRTVPDRIRPAVTFLTLFLGVSTGILTMQGIENAANGGAGGIGVVMASINYLVVVLIAAFMAIALANNLIAAINGRRGEFATMSSVGATEPQVRAMLLCETLVGLAVATLASTLGAVVAVIPFAIAKLGDVRAAAAPGPYLLMIAIGAALTVGVTVFAERAAVSR
ncbi:FtsX-like permease family protein [Naumannella huperziae]